MSKPIGKHDDGSNCYTKGCSRNISVSTANWDQYAKNRGSQSLKPSLPPVEVPTSVLWEPFKTNPSKLGEEYALYVAEDSTPVLYSYDYYGQEYSYDPDAEPYNVYEGLKIRRVNTKAYLAEVHHCQPDELPEELIQKVEASGYMNPEKWEIYSETDYYSDRVVVDPPDELISLLREEYWKQPGANDHMGILKYCRSKGLVTAGKPPLEALKAQLAEEKIGSDLKMVQDATRLEIRQHRLTKVGLAEGTDLTKITPVQPEPFVKGGDDIIGVAVKHENKLYLVDGYGRYKNSVDKRKREGVFVVLS